MLSQYIEVVEHEYTHKGAGLLIQVNKTGEQLWLVGRKAKRAVKILYSEARKQHV